MTEFIELGGEGNVDLSFDNIICQGNEIKLPAGAYGVWTLVLTAGKSGIKEGGGFIVRRQRATSFGFFMQTEDSSQDDFLQAATDADAVLTCVMEKFPTETRDWHDWHPAMSMGIRVTVVRGELKDGERAVITIGQDEPWLKSPIINLRSQAGEDELPDYHVTFYTDSEGNSIFKKTKDTIRCLVINNKPGRIALAADSVTDNEGRFSAVLRVEDMHANLCIDYTGELSLRGSNVSGLADTVSFKEGCGGYKKISAKLEDPAKPGFVFAEDKDAGIKGISNPAVSPECQKQNICWGELHGHTNLSWDGRGDIEDAYHFASEISRLDFSAVTDHTFRIKAGADLPLEEKEWWENYWWGIHACAARKFYNPGTFVPLLAQECHPGDKGDHNIYYPSYDSAVTMPEFDQENPELIKEIYTSLYKTLNKKDALIIPHVGGGPKWSWGNHDEKAEPLLEIASCHGNFESFAQKALQRGYRMGFVFGSDFHCGTPGVSGHVMQGGKLKLLRCKSSSYHNGFTGLLTDNCTLEGTFNALREKKCYAVTGDQRPIIDFRINDCEMGGETICSEYPEISIKIISTVEIRSVTVIRNTEIAYENTEGFEGDVDLNIKDTNLRKGSNYYYLRIIFQNDDLAWSSPVWV
ncbi:MAG: PHP domain-containing protein, partial [Planctomycetota bacterium]